MKKVSQIDKIASLYNDKELQTPIDNFEKTTHTMCLKKKSEKKYGFKMGQNEEI